VPGLVDVRSSLQAGNPELQILYQRDRLSEFGLSLREVAELVRNKVQGRVATDFCEKERQLDVLVRLREADRLGLEELERLVVNPRAAIPIRLAAVADIRVDEGPSEIRRIDQQRAALITANIQRIDLGTASVAINEVMQQIDYPTGFGYSISGQNKEMETSMRSLYFALGLAIFLVYIVMASQFESLLHPFVIMFTVPLALIGVVFALWLSRTAVSVVVFIGLITLAGIVVNNAIVLVDYINHLRRGGLTRREAIVKAGSVRLRPILMTTATTVLGLLPMALGFGEGAEIRTPMALTVITGLVSATLLTLVVIPTVYDLMDWRD
jgi:HAE1 family hydrophobic/amphiphilic exporter-1